MPYLPRKYQIEQDVVYHLLNRGNGRKEIFHLADDYEHFKFILKRYVEKNGLIIYHYCLIPNHYHLEVGFDQVEVLSSCMAGINRSYTHYYHKKYGTAGYLWQGRFKSKPIQKSSYLLSCGGYIETNPVRANIVKNAEDYPHSSARFYILGEPDDLISVDPSYEDFGGTLSEKRSNYAAFLKHIVPGQDGSIYEDFEQPLGSEYFTARLLHKNGRKYPRAVGRVRNI